MLDNDVIFIACFWILVACACDHFCTAFATTDLHRSLLKLLNCTTLTTIAISGTQAIVAKSNELPCSKRTAKPKTEPQHLYDLDLPLHVSTSPPDKAFPDLAHVSPIAVTFLGCTKELSMEPRLDLIKAEKEKRQLELQVLQL